MITYFKIFESKENFELIGSNTAYWGWNDDSQTKNVELLLDKSDNSLYLKISQTWTKLGIGAGTRKTELEFVKIGDFKKSNLSLVRSLLKKHNIQRSSAGYGFSSHWSDIEGNKMSLSDLIKNYKEENITDIKLNLKHIKPISTFKETVDKDIELVQYSKLSYALFGSGTKKIKDELINLGCKYNRFLTDPKTGEKRAGWICSNSKLDEIEKMIKNS